MPVNSRAKGKAGELELAAFLRDRGFDARRGRQYHGRDDAPDVVCEALDAAGIHLECKRVETLRLYDALDQARADGPGKTPVVAHRRSRKEWVAILPLDDFLRLVRERDDAG